MGRGLELKMPPQEGTQSVWQVSEKNVSKWEQACYPLGPAPWMCAHVC